MSLLFDREREELSIEFRDASRRPRRPAFRQSSLSVFSLGFNTRPTSSRSLLLKQARNLFRLIQVPARAATTNARFSSRHRVWYQRTRTANIRHVSRENPTLCAICVSICRASATTRNAQQLRGPRISPARKNEILLPRECSSAMPSLRKRKQRSRCSISPSRDRDIATMSAGKAPRLRGRK